MTASLPDSIDELQRLLRQHSYLADRSLATALQLALRMRRPLLLEGEAGVGKTALATVLSNALGRKLIRLQCYEGLDISTAVYEWNYARQMIEIRLAEAAGNVDKQALTDSVFTRDFLIERPLLQALRTENSAAPVLLIDELDRTDESFEAYLLELLAEYQITIPEVGTIKAAEPPIVILTSNRTREIHDALKRRCLYHWLDYPQLERELAIVEQALPGLNKQLTKQIVSFVQQLRQERLFKAPGIAETLDWAAALQLLDQEVLGVDAVQETLGALLKYQDDLALVDQKLTAEILQRDDEAITS